MLSLGLDLNRADPLPMAFSRLKAECQAACTEAPCLQVNYRHQYRVTPDQFDQLVEDLASSDSDIPKHGVLSQIRQHIPEDKFVGSTPPEDVVSASVAQRRWGSRMTEMAGTPIPHAPGFITNATPRIMTPRFDCEDSLTLAIRIHRRLSRTKSSATNSGRSSQRLAPTLLGRGGGIPGWSQMGILSPRSVATVLGG